MMDLAEAYQILRKYCMRLNLVKCAFGMSSGKLLDFMVLHRGIEANPEKLQAILEMTPSRTRKEVQCLAGQIVALSKLVAKLDDKCPPFFIALR